MEGGIGAWGGEAYGRRGVRGKTVGV
jgi:hypothetical protein